MDEDGEDLEPLSDEKRFLEARNGDHLMTPFQCDLCHFRNVFGRNPIPQKLTDQEALELIRRATLDAFWSRASSTVRRNLSEGKRLMRFAQRLEMPCLVPPMGPYPLDDAMGMMGAMAVLDRSLDKGKTEKFVQWDTFRGARSFVTNASQAGVTGLSDSIGAYEKNRMWISGVPTHSFWFTRFMGGLHRRVGEVKRQDEPISIDVLLTIESILEQEWSQSDRPAIRLQTAEMGVWFIAGFCSGLRGEEMPLIELAGTSNSLQFLTDHDCLHLILVITGRTKGNQLGGAKFGVPIAATTTGSNLQPGKWVKRLCDLKRAKGHTTGRLLKRNLTMPRLYEFEHDFFRLLREVQATTSFIDQGVEVGSSYGILRSCRRGMTVHARNVGVSKEELNTFNRWSADMNSKTGVGRLDMAETYSALDHLKPTLLRVTRPF